MKVIQSETETSESGCDPDLWAAGEYAVILRTIPKSNKRSGKRFDPFAPNPAIFRDYKDVTLAAGQSQHVDLHYVPFDEHVYRGDRTAVVQSLFDTIVKFRAYLEERGKPVAFYSDKHGIFRVNRKETDGGDGVTQFGRALLALNIDIICANSPQAKGRIERAFGTLQDRMVKELRLAGVSSITAANAWLPGFITAYNTRFGRDPANAKDLHRPLAQADDLDEILAWREERTVTRNLTLHYDRMMLLLDPTSLARGLVRKKVEVVNYPDGRFAVQFNGAVLGFKVFDKIQTVQPGAIVDNKRLSAVLEQIRAQQAAYPARQQRGHVARQRPPNNLEAPGLPSKGRAPRRGAAAAAA